MSQKFTIRLLTRFLDMRDVNVSELMLIYFLYDRSVTDVMFVVMAGRKEVA